MAAIGIDGGGALVRLFADALLAIIFNRRI